MACRNLFPRSVAATVSARPRAESPYHGPVFWLPDHPTRRAFPPLQAVAVCGFRSRLQQRVCGGFAPRFPAPTIELSNGVIIDSAFLSVKLRNLGFTPCNLYIVPKAKQEIDHVGKT